MTGSDSRAGAPQPPLTYRVTPRQWLAVDIVIAVLAMAVITFGLRVVHGSRITVPSPAMAAATIAATLPVAVRRLWPLPVLAIVSVAIAALAATGRDPLTCDLMLGMAAYTAARQLPRMAAAICLVLTELVILGGLLTEVATTRAPDIFIHSMLTAAAMWFVGAGVRERRRYLAGLARQEAQRQRAESQHARHELQEERLRIARELHDVLAHSLIVVAVQAGVGRKVGADRPDEALQALRTVEEASRDALDELRRLLSLLRSDDEPGQAVSVTAGAPAPTLTLAPAPDLGDLDGLVATIRRAGIPVRVDVTGDATSLPSAAGLTAYRIVQEALTNVVRHAPGAEATVRLSTSPAGTRIQVTDTGGRPRAAGPADSGAGDGHGIAGMRERAAIFGGSLEAGPLPGGGFRVAAFLPVSATAMGRSA
jgi:signal transduction histidine kinase